jgi:tetratricopeptide (TPR) repeat protein
MTLDRRRLAMVRAFFWFRSLAWLLLFSCFVAGCQTMESERKRQINDDGVFLFSQGNYRGAKDCFELALTLNPRDEGVVYNLAQCYDHLGDAKRAEQHYRFCLELNAKHSDSRQSLAALLTRTGRPQEAGRLVDDFVQSHPNSAEALALEGWRLRQEKNYPKAQEKLQQALALEPHNRHALVELGILYEANGRPERALVLYERVLAEDAKQPELARRRDLLKAQGVSRPLPD